MMRAGLVLLVALAGPAAAAEIPLPPERPSALDGPAVEALAPPAAIRPPQDAASDLAPTSAVEPARKVLPGDSAAVAPAPRPSADPLPAAAAADPVATPSPAAASEADAGVTDRTASDPVPADPQTVAAPAGAEAAPKPVPTDPAATEAAAAAEVTSKTAPAPVGGRIPEPRREEPSGTAPKDARQPAPRAPAETAPAALAAPVTDTAPVAGGEAAAPPVPPAKPAGKPERMAMVTPEAPTPPGAGSGNLVCGDPRLIGRKKATVTGHYPGCLIVEPVVVTSIAGIQLSTPATLSCRAARTFANWVTGIADPAARQILGGRIKRVWVMGSYACRTRNNLRGARLSEHSVGRAVDVGGFTLGDGRKIRVKSDWGRGDPGKFLRHIWKRSCGMFKTVLGPDGDRFHQDHLHMDVAFRKKSYCR